MWDASKSVLRVNFVAIKFSYKKGRGVSIAVPQLKNFEKAVDIA